MVKTDVFTSLKSSKCNKNFTVSLISLCWKSSIQKVLKSFPSGETIMKRSKKLCRENSKYCSAWSFRGGRQGRPVLPQNRCNLNWHQLGLLQPRCSIDFSSAAMWRQPIMADWLEIDWIVTWNSDLFFVWADRKENWRLGERMRDELRGAIQSPSAFNANLLALYAYMRDLRMVVSNTVLLTLHPSY